MAENQTVYVFELTLILVNQVVKKKRSRVAKMWSEPDSWFTLPLKKLRYVLKKYYVFIPANQNVGINKME